jgi:TolA-binding protein
MNGPSAMRRFARVALLQAAMAMLVGVVPARAQQTTAQSLAERELARVDTLIAAGALNEARGRLAAWNGAHPPGGPGVDDSTRARALMLAGRLATTWAAAQEAYIAVALGYPVSTQAPEAMLHLGQGLLAGGLPAGTSRAIAYLERLINDYPNSPFRTQAYLWLARAQAAGGRTAAACASIRQAATLPADSVLGHLIDTESGRLCRG